MVTLAFLGNLAGPDLLIFVFPVLLFFVGKWAVKWVIREVVQAMGTQKNGELEARLKRVEEKLESMGVQQG